MAQRGLWVRIGNLLTWQSRPIHKPPVPPSKNRRYRVLQSIANILTWQKTLELIPTFMNPTLIGITRILIDQALSGTSTIIDDPTAGDIFWPSQQLYDAANETIMDFWATAGRQDVPIALATATAGLVVGTATDIYAFDSTTLMIPTFVTLSTSFGSEGVNQKYFISDRTKLEQYARDWRDNQQAQPKWFILWDAFHLRVFPKPDQTYTFTLWGIPWATEIITGTEDIVVDQILRLAMAYRTAATLLEATRPEVSDLYNSNAEEMLNRYRIRLRNQQGNNLRRMKPGGNGRYTDNVIAANRGSIKVGNRLS
jgi:hypothetical protein